MSKHEMPVIDVFKITCGFWTPACCRQQLLIPNTTSCARVEQIRRASSMGTWVLSIECSRRISTLNCMVRCNFWAERTGIICNGFLTRAFPGLCMWMLTRSGEFILLISEIKMERLWVLPLWERLDCKSSRRFAFSADLWVNDEVSPATRSCPKIVHFTWHF